MTNPCTAFAGISSFYHKTLDYRVAYYMYPRVQALIGTNIRVHEIAYGFRGPSEKNVSPLSFSIAKYQSCVSPCKICPNFAGHV